MAKQLILVGYDKGESRVFRYGVDDNGVPMEIMFDCVTGTWSNLYTEREISEAFVMQNYRYCLGLDGVQISIDQPCAVPQVEYSTTN